MPCSRTAVAGAIAEALYLSVRTVEVYLGRAFRKLGVTTRVELAVRAHED